MKEFIGAKISKELYDMVVRFRAMTGLSITKIIENALLHYFAEVDDEVIQQLRLQELQRQKREENRRLLRGLTILSNQQKLLKKLQKQISKELLMQFVDALREEAKLYGFDLDWQAPEFKIKVVQNGNSRQS